MQLSKTIIISSFLLLLCSCVVKPTVTTVYDDDCQITKNKVELTVEQVNTFYQLNCSRSHDCKSQFVGQVVGAAIVLPLSAIISGSIALVGNTIYWLNEKGRCIKVD